jgi:HTH-type transcriptional repressor of NAD biosynthesis genes
MNKRIGFTLGKYAPLHAGHQLVIDTALAEMDAVIVMIYDAPETTSIPLPIRTQWIRDLYPTVEIVAAWDGPTETGYTPEIIAMHDAYILGQVGTRGITHFYSSERYGEHVSAALGAVNRQVDPPRTIKPISATMIRDDAWSQRHLIAPRVYADLITRVVLLGAPSTGKSTLTAALAAHFDTVWMPEYGREYWDKHQQHRQLSHRQLLEIAKGHIVREDALWAQANRYCFVDTNALTTAMFSQYYHGAVSPKLATLAANCVGRYDVTLVCGDDIPYDDTWDRSGEVARTIFQKQIIADLTMRHIPYQLISGDIPTRIAQVAQILAQLPARP